MGFKNDGYRRICIGIVDKTYADKEKTGWAYLSTLDRDIGTSARRVVAGRSSDVRNHTSTHSISHSRSWSTSNIG